MSVRNRYKTLLNKFFEYADEKLHYFGLSLVRIRNTHVKDTDLTKGRSLLYRSEFSNLIATLPLNRARVRTFTMENNVSGHANVISLNRALRENSHDRFEVIKTILVDYSQHNAKNDISSAGQLGIHSREIPVLKEVPPWYMVYPWSHTGNIEESVNLANFSTFVENKKRGGPPLDAESGGAQNPLVSEARAEFEAKLLHDLLLSVEKKGYRESPNHFDAIGGRLLIRSEHEWCWMVSGGIHRCCVLSALKYRSVPVSIKNAIYRDDVMDWPNVQNGYFDAETALKIFDNILDGNVDSSHREWASMNLLSPDLEIHES